MTEEKYSCNLCPRGCNVDRKVEYGFCGMPDEVHIARAALHMWEEPCISGTEGSGTVFFTGCTLRCVFCQNYNIAAGKVGKNISTDRLSEIFLELQQKGANNINLVTPTHYVPQIAVALRKAKKAGLTVPIVYNTSGYENVETLKQLQGLIDVYLPDFKYMSNELADRYSRAKDYPEVAKLALEEMYRQTGPAEFDDRGMMTSGVIVRHMVLPGQIKDSKTIIKYLYDAYGDNIYMSIMSQYTPLSHVSKYPEINRKITEKEYDEVVDYAISLGVECAFIQEGDVAKESFIPAFDGEGV
ncbi:MAG: radical SAM protein [Lachnospira sp.]|nr:radical SAM protein [Lachnospira sp.]